MFESSEDQWACPYCTVVNPKSLYMCDTCGKADPNRPSPPSDGSLSGSSVDFPVGSRVILTEDYKKYSDAAEGPLRPFEVGTVISNSGGLFRVFAFKTAWYYNKAAIAAIPFTEFDPAVADAVRKSAIPDLEYDSQFQPFNPFGGGTVSTPVSQLITVGTSVVLTDDYFHYFDAKQGPLTPGDVGIIVEVNSHISKPYKVEFGDTTFWYAQQAIITRDSGVAKSQLPQKVAAGVSSAAAGVNPPHLQSKTETAGTTTKRYAVVYSDAPFINIRKDAELTSAIVAVIRRNDVIETDAECEVTYDGFIVRRLKLKNGLGWISLTNTVGLPLVREIENYILFRVDKDSGVPGYAALESTDQTFTLMRGDIFECEGVIGCSFGTRAKLIDGSYVAFEAGDVSEKDPSSLLPIDFAGHEMSLINNGVFGVFLQQQQKQWKCIGCNRYQANFVERYGCAACKWALCIQCFGVSPLRFPPLNILHENAAKIEQETTSFPGFGFTASTGFGSTESTGFGSTASTGFGFTAGPISEPFSHPPPPLAAPVNEHKVIDISLFLEDLPPVSSDGLLDYNATAFTGKEETPVPMIRLISEARRVECSGSSEYATTFGSLEESTEEEGMIVAAAKGLRDTSYYHDSKASDSHTAKNMKAYMKEMKDLRSKISNSAIQAIFVRFDEDYPQFSRAIIAGAEGTPYASGLFVFDIYLPPGYPDIPCEIVHVTKGANTVHANNGPGGFSPNLHSDSGKVCLSLLGTWSGPGWDPNRSSLYQVLSTIQLMILGAEHPYFMEPGHGGWEGTAPLLDHCPDRKRVIQYDEEVKFHNAALCILAPLKSPPKYFEKLVLSHFKSKRRIIAAALEGWRMKGTSGLVSRISPVIAEIQKTFEEKMSTDELLSDVTEDYSRVRFVRNRISQMEVLHDSLIPGATPEEEEYLEKLQRQIDTGRFILEEVLRVFQDSKCRLKSKTTGKVLSPPSHGYKSGGGVRGPRPIRSDGGHSIDENGTCTICVQCGYCSGYGANCVRCKGKDRTADKGESCGCGRGRDVCSGCRMCQVCFIHDIQVS